MACLGWIFASALWGQEGGEGCPRRCEVWMYAGQQYLTGLHDVVSAFRQAAKTEYFSFVDSGDSEYLASVEFNVFENEIFRSGLETDEQGQSRIVKKGPFRSHLIIGLWFVAGKPQDKGPGSRGFDHEFNYFVRDWESWNADMDPLSHKAAILSQIQATSPLHEIAWDFERMPVNIEMEPEKECVEHDEEIKINMKSSRDQKGRNSQPFYGGGCDNRFVFTTERGEILLSGENKISDKEWATSAVYDYYQYRAPSTEECGDCKEDTITVYNSCDVLDPDIYPYSRTRKKEKIYEIKIDIGCDWKGTIESGFTLGSSGDESLLTAMMPKSQYQGKTNWKLDVIFELDRGNERVRIYDLKSARFNFLDQFEAEILMQKSDRKIQQKGKGQAEAKGKELSPSECDLELIIDLKNKKYKIEGVLCVENIRVTDEGRFIIDFGPIQHNEKETDQAMTEYEEEIHIEGKFSEDSPVKLEGSVDEMKEIPPEFADFMEALAGKISGIVRWKLERKGKS